MVPEHVVRKSAGAIVHECDRSNGLPLVAEEAVGVNSIAVPRPARCGGTVPKSADRKTVRKSVYLRTKFKIHVKVIRNQRLLAMAEEANDAKQCPWCMRWHLKDSRCNYVVCGREMRGAFRVGMGCGRAFCFACGKKLCGRMYSEEGALLNANEDHDHGHEPSAEDPCHGPEYCPGGHDAHKGGLADRDA